MGSLLAVMMGANAHTGVLIYRAIKAESAQHAILRTVGDEYLTAEQKTKLVALLQRVKSTATARNLVVHAVWATHDDYPNGIIRVDDNRRIDEVTAAQTKTGPLAYALKFADDSPVGDVYEIRDMTDIEARLLKLHVDLLAFIEEIYSERKDREKRFLQGITRVPKKYRSLLSRQS